MINKVFEALEPLAVPVQYILRPSLDGAEYVISYHFFSDHHVVKGDGIGRLWGSYLQVDLFSYRPTRPHFRRVVELLEKEGLIFSSFDERPDDVVKGLRCYHGILIMTCSDEGVKEHV